MRPPINKTDINPATGGLSPKGWVKLIILLTVLVVFMSTTVLFIQDFKNVSQDYVDNEKKIDNGVVDSKLKFNREYLLIDKGKDEDVTQNTPSANTGPIMWGGYTPTVYYIMQYFELENPETQRFTEGFIYSMFGGCPWSMNMSDGGLGIYQATNGELPDHIQGLYEKDAEHYSDLSVFAHDTSSYMNGGNSKPSESLQLAYKNVVLKDFNRFMDDSLDLYWNKPNWGGSGMTFKERIDSYLQEASNLVFDDLPDYCKSIVLAAGIRSPSYLKSAARSTDPDTIVTQVAEYYRQRYPREQARWISAIEISHALRDKTIDPMEFNTQWDSNGAAPYWKSWLSKYSNITDTTQDTTYLSWKQVGSAPWVNDILLNGSSTIKSKGCALVSVAIMLNDIGVTDDTPREVNRKLKNIAAQSDNIVFSNIDKPYLSSSFLGFNYSMIQDRYDLKERESLSDAISIIRNYINNGSKVIIQIDYKGNDAGDHFVYCTGVTDSDILVADPAKNGTSLLSNYLNSSKLSITSLRIFNEKR